MKALKNALKSLFFNEFSKKKYFHFFFGKFSIPVGNKIYFLPLGMGPNFGTKKARKNHCFMNLTFFRAKYLYHFLNSTFAFKTRYEQFNCIRARGQRQ